jgi:photosystem II stability/assembly factor-like uncharacterized protein
MKKSALFSLLIFTFIFSFGQYPKYLEMMDNLSYNFYEVVDSANAYFEKNGTGKGSGHTPFMRWVNENEGKYYPSGDRKVNHYLYVQEAERLMKGQSNEKYKTQSQWKDLGPFDANNITTHYSPGIGRVETFWINPNNDDTMYLGSRSGGFWRTFDGGKTWQNTTDFLPVSGVFSLTVNPFNHAEILIAIQQGGNNNSHGVYRSTNFGSTWVATNFIPENTSWGGLGDFQRIYQIEYHPRVQNRVYIASSYGLYHSDNNLSTFTRNSVLRNRVENIAFHPTKNDKFYVTGTATDYQNKIYISENAGQTFSSTTILENDRNKLLLAITRARAQNVYVASNKGVWKSVDEGKSFTFLNNPDSDCQGFAVSDLDTMDMIYGFVDPFASINGGVSFRQTSKWNLRDETYVHADIRAAGVVNGVMYLGTDGYLARSFSKGITWEWVNDGTGIREFYAVGLCQGDWNVQMAGSQDNGSSILNKDGWLEWNGGDGMEAIVHPLNNNWMIGSWQWGRRSYTRNGGQTRPQCNNPEVGSTNATWEAPLLLNPLNHMEVFHFGKNIFKGTKFGTDWYPIGGPDLNGAISEAGIAYNNPNIIAVARQGNILLTTDGGQTFKNIRSNLPNYTISEIAFDPKDDNTVIITYRRYQNDGQKIFITKNLGHTWKNITYNLENMPLRCAIIDHSDSSYIFVGGEIGIYYKSMNSTKWLPYMNGLPNVTVKDLEIHYGSNTLRAATWGRGLWEIPLPNSEGLPKISHVEIEFNPTESNPVYSRPQKIKSKILSNNNLSEVWVHWSKNSIELDQKIKMIKTDDDWWESEGAISGEKGDHIYFKVSAKNNLGKSESYRYHFEFHEKNYCAAVGGSNTTANHIIRVDLNGQYNVSGQDYYGDFTNVVFNLEPETQYELEIGMTFSWPENDTAFAWIDYNDNGEFELSELINFNSFNENHKAKAIFTTPGFSEDRLVRMRVRNQWRNRFPTPCGTITGEVEDYSILLRKKVSISRIAQEASIKIVPNPNNNRFRIMANTDNLINQLNIFSVDGRMLQTVKNPSSQEWILHQLPNGVYLIEVEINGSLYYQKMVVGEQ